MKSFLLPTADSPVYEWLGFGLFLLLLCVCLGGLLVWLVKPRGNRAKRKRRHRHHRPTNPTLAQTGGLPPKRAANQPPPGP
jgi:hypothetical protein